MTAAPPLPLVDVNALRANQSAIIVLLIAAFIFNLPVLVLFVGGVMLIGTALGVPGFRPLYARVLVPAGLVKPHRLPDHPEPHRFAQGLGAAFLLASGLALFTGAAALGWALAWLVVALAAINLFAGFCAGCFVYYWLNRLGVPGFTQAAPAGTLPGMRPRAGSPTGTGHV